MANVKTTNLGLVDSIKYFLKYWKYGYNYKDSTILVDPSYNIIAYFDRGTYNIDIIMSDVPYREKYIIGNGKKIKVDKIYKYYPYYYKKAKERYMILKDEYKDKNKLWEQMLKELKNYNKNYFKNLFK